MATKTAKKKPEEIVREPLREILMSEKDWDEMQHGINLFNSGEFWLAHEAWEQIWKRHDEDERLFFQGLIQLAAAYQQIVTRASYRGLLNNFDKAEAKLRVFEPRYCGVYVRPLLKCIEMSKAEMLNLGEDRIADFPAHMFPKIQFHLPNNPDLIIELRSVVHSPEFREAAQLFNTGLFWEAHEAWEEVWRDVNGDAKVIVQIYVQMAAAYSFVSLAKPVPATYLFEKAIARLEEFGGMNDLVNTDDLLDHMRHVHGLLTMQSGRPVKLSAAPPVPKVHISERKN